MNTAPDSNYPAHPALRNTWIFFPLLPAFLLLLGTCTFTDTRHDGSTYSSSFNARFDQCAFCAGAKRTVPAELNQALINRIDDPEARAYLLTQYTREIKKIYISGKTKEIETNIYKLNPGKREKSTNEKIINTLARINYYKSYDLEALLADWGYPRTYDVFADRYLILYYVAEKTERDKYLLGFQNEERTVYTFYYVKLELNNTNPLKSQILNVRRTKMLGKFSPRVAEPLGIYLKRYQN